MPAALAERSTLSPQRNTFRLLSSYSLEMTAKDTPDLTEAAQAIAHGTRMSVTFLPGEDQAARVRAAVAARQLGLVPIPHLSARRLASHGELDGYLGQLVEQAAVDHVFVIAGDLPEPAGPFGDALSIIASGLLEKHGIRHVGISGYPEGHPGIPSDKLWAAMRDKHAALRARGMDVSVITQFGFDAAPMLPWLREVRALGIDAPVYLGVPGPASLKTLLRFAARCGVEASAKVMARYGLSLTRLLGTAGPDALVEDLAAALDPAEVGDARLHFYPFGGFGKTTDWIDNAARRAGF